jgi:hypothetical protein
VQIADGASGEFCAVSKRSAAKLNGIHVRVRDELLDAIDEFRRNERDIPTRPNAIHQLLKEALAARQRRASKRAADDVECRLVRTAESGKEIAAT